MYNYYIDKQRKAIEFKKAQELLNRGKEQDKRKRKMNALVSKYETRVNHFVLKMAEKPIQIKRAKDQFISSRQEYLEENSSKILSKKGFVFTNFKTEKERIKDYLEQQQSLLKYYTNTEVPNYNDKYHPKYRILQPSMRFKPRSDLERVYDALRQQNILDKDAKIIQSQLNRMGFKTRVIQKKGDDDESVESVRSESSEDMIQNVKANSKKELYSKTIDNDLMKQKQANQSQPRYYIKNKEARALRSDLHNKTHFKAVEALCMFKTSTTMNQDAFRTFYKKDYEEQKKLNEDKKNYRTLTDGFKFKKKHFNEQKAFHTLPNLNKDSELNNAVNLLGNKKILQDPDIAREIAKLNPLLFNMNFNTMKNEAHNQPVSNEQLNFLKEMAFESESQQKKEASELKELMKPEIYDDYKKEENILIDGEVFKKQDIDKIADRVLRKCNWNSNKVKYNKFGQGKLMFTNGLTLTEFSTKYGLFS